VPSFLPTLPSALLFSFHSSHTRLQAATKHLLPSLESRQAPGLPSIGLFSFNSCQIHIAHMAYAGGCSYSSAGLTWRCHTSAAGCCPEPVKTRFHEDTLRERGAGEPARTARSSLEVSQVWLCAQPDPSLVLKYLECGAVLLLLRPSQNACLFSSQHFCPCF
jgi:hypothetical protein